MYRKLRVCKVMNRLRKDRRESAAGGASVKEVAATTAALSVDDDGPGVWFRVSIGESVKESTRGIFMSGGRAHMRRVTLEENGLGVSSKTSKQRKQSKQTKQAKLNMRNSEDIQNLVHQTLHTFVYVPAVACLMLSRTSLAYIYSPAHIISTKK